MVTALTDAVIRPSGVWNARAPYHSYLVETNEITRDYSLLTLAVSRTRYDAAHVEDASRSTAKFMRASISGPVARKVWNSYRDYWRRKTGVADGQPTIADAESDLALGLYALREAAVIRWSSVFETFVQCWALNMLLAALETGTRTLTNDELKLARSFSPVHTRRNPPGVWEVLQCFPVVRDQLDALPHINSHPHTRKPVDSPLHPELTAYRAVLFWRSYRNLLVHRGGRISSEFVERYGMFFEAFRQNYSEVMREIRPTYRLQLPSMILPAVATTHTKVARFMTGVLVEASEGRRGRVTGPEEEEPMVIDLDRIPPPLLVDGDHPESLEWVRNAELRDQVVSAQRASA